MDKFMLHGNNFFYCSIALLLNVMLRLLQSWSFLRPRLHRPAGLFLPHSGPVCRERPVCRQGPGRAAPPRQVPVRRFEPDARRRQVPAGRVGGNPRGRLVPAHGFAVCCAA